MSESKTVKVKKILAQSHVQDDYEDRSYHEVCLRYQSENKGVIDKIREMFEQEYFKPHSSASSMREEK